MTKFDAKNQSTGEVVRFDAVPVDVATVLDPGTWVLEEVVPPAYTVNVLEVTFTTAPVLSGSATAGATLTLSGTATAALAYEYRWLADGGLIPGATGATYATSATLDLGKTFIGEMRAQDARGRWTAWAPSSNSITIPAPLEFTVADNKWAAAEATSDANNRKTYLEADCIGNTPPTGILYWYKGPATLGNLAQVSAMDDDGDGTFSKTSASTSVSGSVVYSRLAYWNAAKVGGAGYDWCSAVKTYVTSNVPAAPGAFTATNSTTVTGRVSLDPNDTPPATNGRAILEYGYSENGGAVTAFATGGTATTARNVDFVGIDARTVRIHARNINGWSAGSAPQTVTPPVITGGTNTVAPKIDSNFYGGSLLEVDTGEWTGNITSFTIDIEKSDDGVTGWTTHAASVADVSYWPQTTLDAKYVRAKVTPPVGSPAYSAVYLMKNSPTHVAYFVDDNVTFTTTTPLWGTELTTGGIWLSFMFYYRSGLDPSSGYGFSFGNTANGTNNFSLKGSNGFLTLGGIQPPVAAIDLGGNPSDPQGQWYIFTAYWYKVGSIHYVNVWRNDASGSIPGTSNAHTLASGGWTRLTLGAQTFGTNTMDRLPMCCWLSGTGNPEQFHIDTFNEGKFRNPFDYNFATDPNGATKNFGVPGYRVGSGTLVAADLADIVGSAGTPTVVSGPPTWTDVLPPFVSPIGPATPVPAANIRPLYCPAGTPQAFQYGYAKPVKGALTATPWATAISYALNARVTQGGSTYICVTAHTSGTFATDLTAGNWAIFTINSLTHAGYAAGDLRFPAGSTSLGNILPTVTNGIFTCTTPGTITANVTCGKSITAPSVWASSTSYTIGQKVRTGTPEVYYECIVAHTSQSAFSSDVALGVWQFVYGTLNIVSQTYEPQTMPASPRNAADYDGNGLLCAFDPYPTPAAAGTTYATVAALATAIGAVGAGGYLCVNNLTDTGTDLTIPAGDYGGAVIEAKNLHGVNVKDIFFYDVRNLIIRGFRGSRFKTGGNNDSGNSMIGSDGVWLDHCYGTRFDLTAKVAGASRMRVSNWQTPNDGTAGYHKFANWLEAIFFKGAIAGSGPANYNDRLFLATMDRIIMDRVYVGPWGGLVAGSNGEHADLIQPIYNGKGGYFGGYFNNCAAIDTESSLTLGSQGALYADGNTVCRDLWVNNFVGRNRFFQTISFAGGLSNCSIENSFGKSFVGFRAGARNNACYTDNIVMGAAGTTLTTVAQGTELNTTPLGTLGITLSTVFPQYATYPLSWRALANPAPFYETAGPATFIASLEAKRVALGI